MLPPTALRVGDSRTAVVFDNITRAQIVMYAGASGDYNPLHSDEVYATQVGGYPSVFAHGMLSMGATGKLLTDWIGNGRLTNFGVRFVNLVWPGDTLTATASIEEIREFNGQRYADLRIETVNQAGMTVVAGTATARIEP